ncbi:hypothetical protein [Sessilibacter sp. MAH2]
MRNMQTFLKYSLLALCTLGAIFTAYPFVASLKPSYEANANVPSFKTNWINVGETKKTPDIASPADVFITRITEDNFFIFAVAYDNHRNIYWVAPPYDPCDQIEVNLKENKVFCIYGDSTYISWDFDGKPNKEHFAELLVLPYSKNGNTVRYGRGA